MSAISNVRCRYSKCNQRESESNQFVKCPKCQIARYCSQSCLNNDNSTHSLMCRSDRVLLADDGSITTVQ